MQGEHSGERERKSTMIVQERIKARSQTISLHAHTHKYSLFTVSNLCKKGKGRQTFQGTELQRTHTHKKRFIIIYVTSGEWPCDPRMPRIISKQWKHVTMELQAIYLQ